MDEMHAKRAAMDGDWATVARYVVRSGLAQSKQEECGSCGLVKALRTNLHRDSIELRDALGEHAVDSNGYPMTFAQMIGVVAVAAIALPRVLTDDEIEDYRGR